MTSTISTAIETVTPATAAGWLQRNDCNRPVREKLVEHYGRQMVDGSFDSLNGETIIFSGDGQLLDGQHRLHALVWANVELPFLVVRGASGRSTIDQGRSRTVADVLAMEDASLTLTDARTITATATHQLVYERQAGRWFDGQDRQVTPHQISDCLARHPELRVAIDWMKTKRIRGLSVSVAAFLYFHFDAQEPRKAERFFSYLTDGAGDIDECVRMLRERLIESWGVPGRRLVQVEAAALTIKAWCAYRDGLPMGVLRWIKKGPTAERFPRFEIET